MSRRERVRTWRVPEDERVGCGHVVLAGHWAYSVNRGRWLCSACAEQTRAAETVRRVLAAEARRP